jgi:hypothetical protein
MHALRHPAYSERYQRTKSRPTCHRLLPLCSTDPPSAGPPAAALVDAVAGADEAGLVSEHDELSAVADGELHHGSVDMCLDRER